MALADRFVALSPERRAAAFAQTAARMAVSAALVEKDFWVCWLLGILFIDPELAPHFVFKGGTSLSKVYGVIERFSEDIDLSMSPAFAGIDEERVGKGGSRTQRDKAMAEMQGKCAEIAQNVVLPKLNATLRSQLGSPKASKAWLRYEEEADSHSPVIYFGYPLAGAGELSYLSREVKLELGSLTDQKPTGVHPIRPWVADEFPGVFDDWACSVTALELARTFWEKATILHAEHHRPADQVTPGRYSRHYSDMARLLEHARAGDMLGDTELCARVAQWKTLAFPRAWARYGDARPGSFRLLPMTSRISDLERDYSQMRPMFLKTPPTFDEILRVLGNAERKLNKTLRKEE